MSRQDVLNALQALHHHPDGIVKRQAGLWLEHWQQSLEAWSISDGILHDTSFSLEAQYFCAQTLRTKVSSPFMATGGFVHASVAWGSVLQLCETHRG